MYDVYFFRAKEDERLTLIKKAQQWITDSIAKIKSHDATDEKVLPITLLTNSSTM